MFPRALRIARVRGIDVRVDPSWLVIAALIVWSFQLQFAADHPTAVAVAMAVIAGAGFFASVLAHELGHGLEARHRGVEVEGITLFLFGGVTEMHLEPERPRDEFAVAAVGPWVSLVTAAVCGLVATTAGRLGAPAPIGQVAGLLGWLNLALALFNLVPGAPLDGGRVLRAGLWALTKDRMKAIRWSSRAGQAVAALLVAWAVQSALGPASGTGTVVNALWVGFVGWFMWRAAAAELRQAEARQIIGDRTVAALLTPPLPRLVGDEALTVVADRIAAVPGADVFPVVRHRDASEVVAALHLSDVLETDPHDRAFRRVEDVQRPIDDQPAVCPETSVVGALRRLHGADLLRVVDAEGRVTAVLSEARFAQAMERWHALALQRHRGLHPHHGESAQAGGHAPRGDGPPREDGS
jgi:Zn-dependent protease